MCTWKFGAQDSVTLVSVFLPRRPETSSLRPDNYYKYVEDIQSVRILIWSIDRAIIEG